MMDYHETAPDMVNLQELYPIVQDLTEAEYGNLSLDTGNSSDKENEKSNMPSPTALRASISSSSSSSTSSSSSACASCHEDAGACSCSAQQESSSFSLKDLAIPVTTPRTLPPTIQQSVQHKRVYSLFSSCPNASVSTATCTTTPPSSPLSRKHKRALSLPIHSSHIKQAGRLDDDAEFNDLYVLTRQIYRCRISTIWECIHRHSGTRRCVKVVDRRRFTSQADEEETLQEIEMLKALPTAQGASPWVELVEVLEDDVQFYIVMNLEQGGNLTSKILSHVNRHQHHQTSGGLDERQVQALACSLLEAIEQLHKSNIAHLDLQPDNLLVMLSPSSQEPPEAQVSICDFATARNVKNDAGHHTRHPYQNIHYASPEAIKKGGKRAGLASDMWSIGVILYYCLSGALPFEQQELAAPVAPYPEDFVLSSLSGHSTSSITSSLTGATGSTSGRWQRKLRLVDQIIHADYKFSGAAWRGVSRHAKRFLSGLLNVDPQVRMTASEALNHAWLYSVRPFPDPLMLPPLAPPSRAARTPPPSRHKSAPPTTGTKHHHHHHHGTKSPLRPMQSSSSHSPKSTASMKSPRNLVSRLFRMKRTSSSPKLHDTTASPPRSPKRSPEAHARHASHDVSTSATLSSIGSLLVNN